MQKSARHFSEGEIRCAPDAGKSLLNNQIPETGRLARLTHIDPRALQPRDSSAVIFAPKLAQFDP
jgi:hypothetical protein